MRYSLLHPWPSIRQGTALSYGGNQGWLDGKTLRGFGCGVIGGLDLLIYLSRFHVKRSSPELEPLVQQDPIPLESYNESARQLNRRYLPLIPRHGINGVMLALGINLFFAREHIPYYAVWGVPSHKFWRAMETMLERDLPVILSIGPNFPLFWQHNKLALYGKRPDGSLTPATKTVAHYVTVTGMDEEWLRISSWGREYYISRREYIEYVRAHSARFVSNILWINRISR